MLGIDKPFSLHIKRKKLKNSSGSCEEVEPGDFKIRITKGMAEFQETEILGHELVHLKQYLDGRLKDLNLTPDGYLYEWQGQEYQCGKLMDDYFLCPWEMEARAMEAYLAYRWDSRK